MLKSGKKMKKIVSSTLTLTQLSVNTLAYDGPKAKKISTFYSHTTQKTCVNSKLFVKAVATMKMIRENKGTLLGVRTED